MAALWMDGRRRSVKTYITDNSPTVRLMRFCGWVSVVSLTVFLIVTLVRR